ncbi:sulfatase-like hydrolase/transferase [Microbacterium sp. LMI12-1-1.1]|uniref:sulfatase-like hydrolase/transferase n=1 Tax=Microbacterium sp. LMI12-1-1.1 TaxID=3135225 RepID=UPI0034157D61
MQTPNPDEPRAKPNILMVLLDDLGYTDLGVYGGEASTVTIDTLAEDGVQLANFHAYPVCAPTRASLMTGQDPHRVGLGSQEGFGPPGVPATTPGYSGFLEGKYTGIAQVLSDVGYDTYQVGKWHLGEGPEQSPQALGFDENFTLYDGAASHFGDMLRHAPRDGEPVDTVKYERNGEPVETLADDFYSTHAYTDELLRMLDEDADSENPFFGYLAYTAPHDPLHVPDRSRIDHYLDRYLADNNYEELRADRIAALAAAGLIDHDVATRWPVQTPQWDALTTEQKRDLAYRLAVYAAMIEDVDKQLGRIVTHLQASGEYDNTLIVVASDNGASSVSRVLYTAKPGNAEWQQRHYPLRDVDDYGSPGSYPTLGLPNAQVSSGPFFHSKGSVFEGGTRAPAIIKPPAAKGDAPKQSDTFVHVSDLYPTFADYAGADLVAPESLLGSSARPLLEGTSDLVGTEEFGMELLGHRAYRDGDWKLVYAPVVAGGTGVYSLYNLADDPGETKDVIDAHGDVAEELARKWDQYAADQGVVDVDFDTVNEGAARLAELVYAIDWAD